MAPITMPTMFSSLSVEHVLTLLPAHARSVEIEVVDQTGSTNADLLARLPQLCNPVLRVAARQTAGRGRAGRSWQAAPEGALLCSLAWPFFRPLQSLSGLTLATGVVLAEILQQFDVPARLKWPNDVLLGEGKLAGILVETAPLLPGSGTWAVIGIGINLALPPAPILQGNAIAHAPQLLKQRNEVLAALVGALAEALPRFARHGLSPFVAEWNQLHAHANQDVVILDQGRLLHQGKAVGIDTTGRLILETSEGQVNVTAGDVSLRSQAVWTSISPLSSSSQPCKG